MRSTHFSTLGLSSLLFACSAPEPRAVGRFTLEVDPGLGEVASALHTAAPLVQNERPDEGPAGTFELVTTEVRAPGEADCPSDRNCFSVRVRSFRDAPAGQLYASIDAIAPPLGRSLADPDPAPAGLSAGAIFGLRNFGDVAAFGVSERPFDVFAPTMSPFRVHGTLWERVGGPTCAALVDGSVCDDGDACTLDDRCAGGLCVGGDPVDCPESFDPCRARTGACVPATGQCRYAAANDGAACSDGDGCSVGDTCRAGACQPGLLPMTCPPGWVCADGGCRDPNNRIEVDLGRAEVDEGGAALQGCVRLSSPAPNPIVVTINNEDPSAIVTSVSSLTFVPADGTDCKPFSVSAPQDADVRDELVAIWFTASSLFPSVATVAVADDDQQGFVVGVLAVEVAEGGSTPLPLALSFEPTSDLVVVASVEGADGKASVSGPLTFTAANYATPQSFVVSGLTDADSLDEGFAGGGAAWVRLSVGSAQGDVPPEGAPRVDVPLSVLDDD